MEYGDELPEDPNLLLQELRAAIERATNPSRGAEACDVRDDSLLAFDLFEKLDEWLVSGGYLPLGWGAQVASGRGEPDPKVEAYRDHVIVSLDDGKSWAVYERADDLGNPLWEGSLQDCKMAIDEVVDELECAEDGEDFDESEETYTDEGDR